MLEISWLILEEMKWQGIRTGTKVSDIWNFASRREGAILLFFKTFLLLSILIRITLKITFKETVQQHKKNMRKAIWNRISVRIVYLKKMSFNT